MPRQCPFCKTEVPETPNDRPNNPHFECPVCGTYRLSEEAALRIYALTHYASPTGADLLPNSYLISAVIRERFEHFHRTEIFIPDFDEILASARPLGDPLDSVDRLLLHCAFTTTRAGEIVKFNPPHDYPIGYAKDAQEFAYFLELAGQMGFLETVAEGLIARVSPVGWHRLRQLRLDSIDQDSAFVAMNFRPELRAAYAEGIQPALDSAGYHTIRVDLIQHNGKIDDRIIADIRKSALMVADFTGHRQNVYFEAGFAQGLGRHIIRTCQEDDIARAHFDTRQYNHVVWQDAADLKEKLRNRIEATVPRRGDVIGVRRALI